MTFHPNPDVMYEADCFRLIEATVRKTDQDRVNCGLPGLAYADMDLSLRCTRMKGLLTGDVGLDELAAVGAQLVAAMRAEARRENLDVTAGEAT